MWTDFWTFLTPPPLWTILLNRAYVVIWTFGKPPSPCHVHMVYECPLMENSPFPYLPSYTPIAHIHHIIILLVNALLHMRTASHVNPFYS